MTRILAAMALSLFAFVALAGDARIFRAEASGHLVIQPDGTVASVQFDESFGKEIDPILKARVLSWRFEPILKDGKPVRAAAYFRLALQAEFAEGRQGQLRITNAQFVDPPESGRKDGRGKRDAAPALAAPRYPKGVLREGYGAEVTIIAKLDEHGNVIATSGQNSWLTGRDISIRAEKQQRVMALFIEASEKAVMQWKLPELAEAGKRHVLIPITFTLDRASPWRRAHLVRVEKQPWTAEAGAQPLAMVGPGGAPPRDDVRLLDALDPE